MSTGIGRDLRTGRFWWSLVTHLFAAIGFQAVLLELYDVFEPDEISKSDAPLPWIVLALAAVFAIYRAWPRPVEQAYSRPNTMVRVFVGDLFELQSNLVIGMATTFDTAIPHVISTGSVQGQFLTKVYASDVAALDQEITQALAGATPTGTIAKAGKTDTYPIGTIAVLRHNRRHYFCAAYTEMNDRNEAHGNIPGVWRCLENLWDEVRAHSNGDPIAIPVIGGGQARMSQDAVRLIVLSFMLASRERRVCERLDIVVRKQDVRALDMLELQAFLTSLQAS